MISAPDKAAAIAQCADNIKAVLAYYALPEVEVLAAQTDRLMTRCPATFIEDLRLTNAFDTWRFNSNHGTTARDGWRENVPECSLQVVLHSTGVLELDIDLRNPGYGDVVSSVGHLFEVLANKIGRKRTDPWKIRDGLRKRGIFV